MLTLTVVAALTAVWNTWFGRTRIAFVNYQVTTLGEISKANDNPFIKIEELPLDKLDDIDDYDMVFVNAMGIRLTEELINEGFVYEVISKIQTMRKDSGFEVMDHITVTVSENDKIADIIRANEEAISTKVLADEIVFGGSAENAKKWNINGEDVLIGVTRK